MCWCCRIIFFSPLPRCLNGDIHFFFSSGWGSPGSRVLLLTLSIAGIGPQKCLNSVIWTSASRLPESVKPYTSLLFFSRQAETCFAHLLSWNGVAAFTWCPTPAVLACFQCHVAQRAADGSSGLARAGAQSAGRATVPYSHQVLPCFLCSMLDYITGCFEWLL